MFAGVMCYVCEKKYIWNPSTCNCENRKYLASITDDLAFTCDEFIGSHNEDAEAKPKLYDETNFNEKKATCKMQNFYIFLAFLLITIALLIAVCICCYLIKHQAKQSLPFHYINNELRKVLF